MQMNCHAIASQMKDHLGIIFVKNDFSIQRFCEESLLPEQFYGDLVNVWIQKKNVLKKNIYHSLDFSK